jgi:hypothetical protein
MNKFTQNVCNVRLEVLKASLKTSSFPILVLQAFSQHYTATIGSCALVLIDVGVSIYSGLDGEPQITFRKVLFSQNIYFSGNAIKQALSFGRLKLFSQLNPTLFTPFLCSLCQ